MAADMVKIDLYPQAYFQGCKMSTESCIYQANKGANSSINGLFLNIYKF